MGGLCRKQRADCLSLSRGIMLIWKLHNNSSYLNLSANRHLNRGTRRTVCPSVMILNLGMNVYPTPVKYIFDDVSNNGPRYIIVRAITFMIELLESRYF